MNRAEFVYDVYSEVTFTRPELEVLWACSQSHYDYKCKDASRQGGFLFGMRNVIMWAEEEGKTEGQVKLTRDQLDTLCKIMECLGSIPTPEQTALYNNVRQLLCESSVEYRRVNNMPER